MTHRAESILSAAVTRVTGLATTGARVYRGRVYPLAGGELPALLIYQGEDRLLGEYTYELTDWELTVYVEARVKSPTAQVDTTLNQIRAEVAQSLMAANALNLAYVIEVSEGDAEAPELSGDGDQAIGALRTGYRVHYRRLRSNPEA